MDKANDIITNIIKEVLTALYQPFGAAVLMAFVSMFVFLYAREHGWKKGSLIKNIFGTWFRNFKESSTFRRALYRPPKVRPKNLTIGGRYFYGKIQL